MTEELFVAQVTDTLSVADVAEELGISRRAIGRAVADGQIRSVVFQGHRYFHASWVEEYRLACIRSGWGVRRGRGWSKGLKGTVGRPRKEKVKGPGQGFRSDLKVKAMARDQPSGPRLGCPPVIPEVCPISEALPTPVTVISLNHKRDSLPVTVRTAPPALANPRVQPRPKSSWLPKKERGRVEEGRV